MKNVHLDTLFSHIAQPQLMFYFGNCNPDLICFETTVISTRKLESERLMVEKRSHESSSIVREFE